jgi:hypothetical protein
MLNEEWERREQLEKLQEEQKLMLEQERHKREEFQQMKVRRTGGAEAHVGARETQERGVPADEGREERRSRSSCWSRRDTRERSSSR